MARNIKTSSSSDTIVAPATPPGSGAIAIVRLSGPDAHALAARHFSASLETPAHLKLGYFIDKDQNRIDQCLACRWDAPSSFTGDHMVEFHLHGSPSVVTSVLEALTTSGARPAEPGEFTRRAFLNGKLDLAQAEAVSDLSRSQTDAARRAALNQLRGGLSEKLLAIRQDLVQVAAELEANVDYPEEDIPAIDIRRLSGEMEKALTALRDIYSTFNRGNRLKCGARVVFAGAPNAGKSSLFNAILRRERAIVSPHAGTTRDSLEATIDLRGIPVTLIDTAGLRANPEEIEAIGIARTREEIETADLIAFVIDSQDDDTTADTEYAQVRTLPHILVYNKTDTVPSPAGRFSEDSAVAVVYTSVKEKRGIVDLENAFLEHLSAGSPADDGGVVITSARHAESLRVACDQLAKASDGLANDISAEFVVIDLTAALSEIDFILGKQGLDEDVLDAVFNTFCLGK